MAFQIWWSECHHHASFRAAYQAPRVKQLVGRLTWELNLPKILRENYLKRTQLRTKHMTVLWTCGGDVGVIPCSRRLWRSVKTFEYSHFKTKCLACGLVRIMWHKGGLPSLRTSMQHTRKSLCVAKAARDDISTASKAVLQLKLLHFANILFGFALPLHIYGKFAYKRCKGINSRLQWLAAIAKGGMQWQDVRLFRIYVLHTFVPLSSSSFTFLLLYFFFFVSEVLCLLLLLWRKCLRSNVTLHATFKFIYLDCAMQQ